MNIIIFKTSVQDIYDLDMVKTEMDELLGEKKWTVALDDEEKILRVVSSEPCVNAVSKILSDNGFYCEELPLV